jgi:hypothetical protein
MGGRSGGGFGPWIWQDLFTTEDTEDTEKILVLQRAKIGCAQEFYDYFNPPATGGRGAILSS